MQIELMQEFIELDKLKKEKEADVEKITKRLKELDVLIQDDMINSGIDNIKINGSTLYIHRQTWAKVLDKEKLPDALISCGLGEYVKQTVSSQSLSAYIRETLANGDELPEELNDIVTTSETVQIRRRG